MTVTQKTSPFPDMHVDSVTHLGGIPEPSYFSLVQKLQKSNFAIDLPDKAFTGCIKALTLYAFQPDLSSSSKLLVDILTQRISECGTGPCTYENNNCQNDSTCNVRSKMIKAEDETLVESYYAHCECTLGYAGANCTEIDLKEVRSDGGVDKRSASKKKDKSTPTRPGDDEHRAVSQPPILTSNMNFIGLGLKKNFEKNF